jgi:hypothetical protein
MDQDQLAQLLAALPRQHKKVDTFATADSIEWPTWRTHFEEVAIINGWGDERCRREIKASMKGIAARTTAEITIAGKTMEQLLDAYQNKFVPPAAGQLARLTFVGSRQLENEDAQSFHSRLREQFARAYPGQAPEENLFLIGQFCRNLIDQAIVRHCLIENPLTYQDALAHAQRVEASNIAMGLPGLHSKVGAIAPPVGPVGAAGAQVAAVGQATAISCWYCAAPHHRNTCEAYIKAKAYFQTTIDKAHAARPDTGSGSGGGGNRGGNRGRGYRSRGGRGRGGGPSIAAVTCEGASKATSKEKNAEKGADLSYLDYANDADFFNQGN